MDQIEGCLHAMIVGQNIDLRRAIRLCVCGLVKTEVPPGRADGYSAAECAERVGTSMKAEASQAFGGDATQQETFVRSFCECNERIDVEKHPVGSEGMKLEGQRCLLSAVEEAGGDPPSR